MMCKAGSSTAVCYWDYSGVAKDSSKGDHRTERGWQRNRSQVGGHQQVTSHFQIDEGLGQHYGTANEATVCDVGSCSSSWFMHVGKAAED